jgi:hypothetical protein
VLFEKRYICGPHAIREHAECIALKTAAQMRRKRFDVYRAQVFIYSRDNHRCVWCRTTYQRPQLSVDHLVPLDCGGTNDAVNLVTSCSPCNALKGRLMPNSEEWLKVLKGIRDGLDYATLKQWAQQAHRASRPQGWVERPQRRRCPKCGASTTEFKGNFWCDRSGLPVDFDR